MDALRCYTQQDSSWNCSVHWKGKKIPLESLPAVHVGQYYLSKVVKLVWFEVLILLDQIHLIIILIDRVDGCSLVLLSYRLLIF